jgi:hypothetical protein
MRKRSLFALLASPILVAGTAAVADDKTFPGAMCQPTAESDTALVRDESTGGIFNEGESVEALFCPIVRDVIAAGTFRFARIVVARTATEPLPKRPFVDVECSFMSNSAFGQTPVRLFTRDPFVRLPPPVQRGDARRVLVIIPPDVVSQTLDVAELEFRSEVDPSVREGYYFILCFLETGEGIISYRISER